MMKRLLPEDAHIGLVALKIQDLESQTRFYTEKVGLKLLHEDIASVVLGAGERPLLRLQYQPDLRPPQRGVGLYHFALLVPTRKDLAGVLRNFMRIVLPLEGAADHLVSEAVYLRDPEGNGIEIYADRPREEWEVSDDGTITIDTIALKTNELLSLADDKAYAGLPDNTRMGHVHLHSYNQPQTVSFYTDVIGFDVVSQVYYFYFMSAGGYHHHVAVQRGFGPNRREVAGLDYYELMLPNRASLMSMHNRLSSAGVHYQPGNDEIFVTDPAGNGIRITLAEND